MARGDETILIGSVNGSVEQSLPLVRAREKIDATVNRESPNGSLSFVSLIYDADRNKESRRSFLLLGSPATGNLYASDLEGKHARNRVPFCGSSFSERRGFVLCLFFSFLFYFLLVQYARICIVPSKYHGQLVTPFNEDDCYFMFPFSLLSKGVK